MDYLYAQFGDFNFNRFGFIATTVGVSKDKDGTGAFKMKFRQFAYI